ncbi:MAG: hypothetical protein KAS32_11760 [Candidatus Peribacteraceae bacterium]|nr:hypothetical protein [Candidatus Peribacteraceae bacterium]
MPRINWKRSEEELLVKNYATMTTEELHNALPNRSKKSINRKLEKLREEGKIGHRDKTTVKRAYYQRGRGNSDESGTGRKRRGRSKSRFPVEDYGYEEV